MLRVIKEKSHAERRINTADDKPHVCSSVAITGYRFREIRVGDWAVDPAVTAIRTSFWVVEVDNELATSTIVNVVGDMSFYANKKA
jgi:hypothetical protein